MMKRYGNLLVAVLLSATFFSGALQVWAEEDADQLAGPPDKKEAASDSQNQEVVIKGVQRLRVNVDKPESDLNFDVDEIAVPYVKTEDYVLDVSPTSMANPAVSIPDKLNSQLVASPYVRIFQRPPILTLRPRYTSNAGIAKWRLRITDGFGNVFKDFSGTNSLPASIVWEGEGKNNEMLDVGTSYSYIFSIIDVASNPTSQMGKPVVLDSLLYEENNVIIAKVVGTVMFDKKERRTAISEKGKLYLREVVDLLMSRQNYPLVIEAYAKDVDDANYKGELIQKELTERLILSPKKIEVVARKANLEKILFRIK